MIQINTLRENPDHVVERLAIKCFDAKEAVSKIILIDENRRNIQNELEQNLNQQNLMAKQIGEMYKSGKKAEADDLKNKSAALKQSSQKLDEQLGKAEQDLNDELVKLPNIPSEKVPPG